MVKVTPELYLKIERRFAKQDKRWPITISLANNKEGFVVRKNWMSELRNWQPIMDHPRMLDELVSDPMCMLEFKEKLEKLLRTWNLELINDRILVSGPYDYDDEDLKELKKFCNKNSLKFESRSLSPFYIGAKLVVIYEDDLMVEMKVRLLLSEVDEYYCKKNEEENVSERRI